MSLAQVKDTITHHFNNSDGFEEIEFQFFGGEPFLEFETIKGAAEWTWSKKQPKPYIFFATTNGTLVHGEIREWCAKNKDRMCLGLSLDGTPSMHNTNRSNSFKRIDAPFFFKNWPKQSVKMTVSLQTLPKLAAGIIYLHELGFKIHCNLAQGKDWSDQGVLRVFAAELQKLIDFYISHPHIEPCSLLDIRLDALTKENNVPKKWCGAATDMVAVDVDGAEYPCQLFTPLVMEKKLLRCVDKLYGSPEKLTPAKCRSCVLLPICPTCYGMNILQRANPVKRDMMLCKLFKIQALAASQLQAQLILLRDKIVRLQEFSPQTITRMIDGIEKVQTCVKMPSIAKT